VQGIDLDSMGIYELIRVDPRGFFLFDMSSQPACPLVSGMPLFLDNSGASIMEPQKLMPLVLMVPSCRGQY
jgi:hypothetical protein